MAYRTYMIVLLPHPTKYEYLVDSNQDIELRLTASLQPQHTQLTGLERGKFLAIEEPRACAFRPIVQERIDLGGAIRIFQPLQDRAEVIVL